MRMLPRTACLSVVVSAALCWALPSPVGAAGPGRLPCKIQPGDQGHIVHVQIGVEAHSVCDSVYDPETDTVFARPGDADATDARVIPEFMKRHRGLEYYAPIDKSVFKTPPSGWCSWYYYYRNLNEAEAVKNLEWMARNLAPFGAEYVQIDDIWQLQGDDNSKWWRDWTGVYEDRFPHGMKWLADEIHRRGMKAGIWLACFGQTNSQLVEDRPDLWLRNEQGQYVNAGWVGRYLCDPSTDAAQDYLGELFTRLAEDWGYDYFKIDGQPPTAQLLRRFQKSLRDPTRSGDEAYRMGLRAIREAIGPQRFLLGCWGTPTEGIGFMNGSRTGGDVGASWRGFQPAIDCTMRWYFTHNIAWYADPDTLLVRPPLTLDQARAWASLYGLTGQLLMASDKMYELPADRVEVLKRVFPPADLRPMCLYAYEGRPRLWHMVARVPGLQRDVVGLFNWTGSAQPAQLNFADLGDGFDNGGPVGVYDFWNGRYVGRFENGIRLTQKPTSCDVLSVCALADRPQLISTSRHITQGAIDLEQIDWEPDTASYSGVSKCVKDDPYTLTFLLDTAGQESWTAISAQTSGPEAVIDVQWPLARVSFTPKESTEVIWRVGFAPMPRPPKATLSGIEGIQAESHHWRRISLQWEAVAGAAGYHLSRAGKPLGIILGNGFTDLDLTPETAYRYSVQAYGAQGELGPSATVSAMTRAAPTRPPKPDVYITDLRPVSVKEGWRTTQFNKSIEGNTLRIADEEFEHGIGTHAYSEIVYDIGGKGFKQFVALVGIDEEISAPEGTCAFQVFLDGKKAFDSDVVTAGDAPLGVTVDVREAGRIKLVATDGGDGINYDHADWAEAGFIR